MSGGRQRKAATLSEERKSLLRDAFGSMDRDGDGYLDYDEAKAAVKALGLPVKKSFVVSMIRMYDKRDENKISFDDFYFVVSEKLSNQTVKDEITHAFNCFTATSKITLEDLREINKNTEFNLTAEELQSMIKEFDSNQDGSIDIAEFAEIMMATV